MSDYHHVYRPTAWPVNVCRCGHQRVNGPPDDCPTAMREEITALRAQVEALKEGAGSVHKAYARGRDEERVAVVAFLRLWRDGLVREITRRQFTRAATDVENGAHHRV